MKNKTAQKDRRLLSWLCAGNLASCVAHVAGATAVTRNGLLFVAILTGLVRYFTTSDKARNRYPQSYFNAQMTAAALGIGMLGAIQYIRKAPAWWDCIGVFMASLASAMIFFAVSEAVADCRKDYQRRRRRKRGKKGAYRPKRR